MPSRRNNRVFHRCVIKYPYNNKLVEIQIEVDRLFYSCALRRFAIEYQIPGDPDPTSRKLIDAINDLASNVVDREMGHRQSHPVLVGRAWSVDLLNRGRKVLRLQPLQAERAFEHVGRHQNGTRTLPILIADDD
ncbi:hypothetical protein X797_001467 [Metarhizium robertsii]|uniref:Uncharacterized protein n=2 Tax=Metarhizium robertsii TaxID=568076 RepID=E9EY71_METRA|nr:uncharacterized protein MAA_04970 [Metarhizium robertsii ARSEF 23]EFZ00042.1 hypothetical protein MAA_04970 [Metarhizium robertsii ARSEF 23]EXV06745.1 hypothetical protein X797_001467 [Metarhizium robertsii]